MQFALFDWLEHDGRPLGETLEDRLQMLEHAEALGFHAYHLAQHEGTPLSLNGAPSVVLAAAAARTSRLRLVPTTYCLPWFNPLRLYHEICLLDHLSRGRLEVGIGRGASPIEGKYYGIESADQARSIAREVMEILLLAFQSSILNYQGEHFSYDGLELYDKPYQTPYPEFWYPSSNIESTPFIGAHGFHTSHNFAPNALAKAHFDRLRAEYAAHAADTGRMNGHGGPPKLANTRHVYVAATDQQAVDEARTAFEQWGNHISYLSGRFSDRPRDGLSLEARMANGTALVGSPETVRGSIQAMIDETGVNYFLGVFAFGGLPLDRVQASLGLFAAEVMPAFTAVRA